MKQSLLFLLAAAGLAACSSGATTTPVAVATSTPGGTITATAAPTATPTVAPTTASTATATPTATATATTTSQQVVSVALPSGTMGSQTDPTFGVIGGYTASTSSQILGFVPGQQIMIKNVGTTLQHTLNVLSTSSFPAVGTSISTSSSGGSTLASGYATGTLNPGQLVGPITLQAGTYYIGCAFHYSSNTMRDVIVVSASATPGPQATAQPGSSGYL
jgi:hypothetical protein